MKVKINDIANLVQGANQSRVSIGESEIFYDQDIFENDFNNMFESLDSENSINTSNYLSEGDVVISSSSHLATIVRKNDKRLVLTANFIKVILENSINSYYFVYLYNFNQNVKKQKEKATQTMGQVKRLTLKSIGEIEIPELSLNKQRLIGQSYVEMLKLHNKISQFSDLFEKLTYSILEENTEDK